MELFKSKQLKTLVFICLMTGIAVALEAYFYTTSHHQSEYARVLVAKRNINKGESIEMLEFDLEEIKKTDSLLNNWVTDQDLHLVQGLLLKERLEKGARLSFSIVESSRKDDVLTAGNRAVMLDVVRSENIRKGDWVDVFWLPAQTRDFPMVIVENAKVLGVKKSEPVMNALIAIPKESLAIVEKAQTQGKLKLTLRNHSERNEGISKNAKDRFIRRVNKGIEIINGG